MLKGKFFKEILKRSLLTLVVPFLTIIFMYMEADSVIREQILLSHESVLNQFLELVDEKMERAEQIIYEVAFRDDIKSYRTYPDSRLGYQRIQLIEALRKLVDEEMLDLFVYYNQDNRIVSGVNGTLICDMYRTLYFPDVTEEDFKQMLSESSRKPQLHILKNDAGERYLYMAMASGSWGNTSRDYVVVIVFNESFIPKMIQSQFGDMGGTLLLFDSNLALLKSEDGKYEYHLNDYTGKGIPFKTKINGEGYMMQVQSSRVIDIYYGFATSETFFWEALGKIRLLCLFIGLACVGISIVLTYRNSKRSYRPIMDMVANVQKYGGQAYETIQYSEFEFLDDFMKQNANEMQRLSVQLAQSADVQKERFLISLVGGRVEYKNKSDSVFADNGIELCSNRFMVALVCVEESLEIELELAVFMTNNVLSDMLQEKCISYFARINANCCMLLINLKGQMELADYAAVLEEGGSYLQNRCKLTVTIALGGIYEGIEGIRNSYSEAEQAEKYKFLWGLGKCIQYVEICNRKYVSSQTVESKLFKKVAGFVKDKNAKKTEEEFLKEILEMYEISEQSSMLNVESFRYELFCVLHRISVSEQTRAEENSEKLRELMRQHTLEAFCKKTAEFLKHLQGQEREKEAVDTVCIKCKEYIDTEYKNQQLSVTAIGNAMGLYHEYLSKLFRRRYGVSIPEYIALTRIKNCKQQLQETNKSIAEIAEENGFANSSVFIRTFKKYEGITPGMYRDLS